MHMHHAPSSIHPDTSLLLDIVRGLSRELRPVTCNVCNG